MIDISCPPPVVSVHVGRVNCQTAADLSKIMICDSGQDARPVTWVMGEIRLLFIIEEQQNPVLIASGPAR